jgi:hypothetical protein
MLFIQLLGLLAAGLRIRRVKKSLPAFNSLDTTRKSDYNAALPLKEPP